MIITFLTIQALDLEKTDRSCWSDAKILLPKSSHCFYRETQCLGHLLSIATNVDQLSLKAAR